MVGFNKRAAACNGVSVVRNIIISAILSGGLAGIAGAVEVMGVQRKLLEGISGECGYTAVLIALLASNHPVGVLFAAIGFAAPWRWGPIPCRDRWECRQLLSISWWVLLCC